MIKRNKGIKMVYQKISNTKEGNNAGKENNNNKKGRIYRKQIGKWRKQFLPYHKLLKGKQIKLFS